MRASTKDSIGKHAVDHIKIPNFNIWVHCADSAKVTARVSVQRRGSKFIGRLLMDRNIEPFNTKGNCWEHKVVVDIEVIGLILIDVDFELGNFVFGFSD